MTLDLLPLDQEAVITAVGGQGALRCRLPSVLLISHFSLTSDTAGSSVPGLITRRFRYSCSSANSLRSSLTAT